MTAPDDVVREQIALYLRRPDGTPLDDAARLAMTPRTLLVVEVDASTADDGPPPRTLGRVIGWVTPPMAGFGRAMLTGACQAVNSAASELAKPAIPGLYEHPYGTGNGNPDA